MKFKEIEFGMAAAENERSSKPHLLTEGFLDAYGYVNAVLNENKFLILGPKGSGKSAIGSKLELESVNDNRLYVQTYYLEDFPYNTFSGILPGREAPETKFPNHWEFILLISFMDTVLPKLPSSEHNSQPRHHPATITSRTSTETISNPLN